jgi:hypothetical protein
VVRENDVCLHFLPRRWGCVMVIVSGCRRGLVRRR